MEHNAQRDSLGSTATSKPAVEQQAFTIKQFCDRNNISLPKFYKERNAGRGPRLMHLGGRAIRISIEAERDWRVAQETLSDDTEERLLQRQERARVAAKASVAARASKRLKAAGA